MKPGQIVGLALFAFCCGMLFAAAILPQTAVPQERTIIYSMLLKKGAELPAGLWSVKPLATHGHQLRSRHCEADARAGATSVVLFYDTGNPEIVVVADDGEYGVILSKNPRATRCVFDFALGLNAARAKNLAAGLRVVDASETNL